MPDLDLPVAPGASANADDRDVEAGGDLGRQGARHQFQDNGEGACGLKGKGVVQEGLGADTILGLNLQPDLML